MTTSTRLGNLLLLLAVVVLVVPLVGSAVTAPTIGETGATDGAGADGPRQTLVGSQGGGAGLHEDGSVYLLSGSEMAWREGSADSYFDVTMTDDGTVLAGFMHSGYTDCGAYESPCTHTGYRVIDVSGPEPRVTEEYSFPVRTRKNSEVHDVEPLPSGELVLTDMEHERIFTLRDGEVTWEWRASDFYDAPSDPTRRDWLHINDVDYIGDDRFLVSVRNANQLVIVERGQGVVEVINEDRTDEDDSDCTQFDQLSDTDGDGDVSCGDPDLMDHQHNPQWLGDGAVLVADSENNRIVELHRTDDGWEPVWTLRQAEGVQFSWPRDADRLPNGNTLVTDSANQRIVEVNESGATVWSYRTPLIPYEAERLPAGETVGATLYGSPGDTTEAAEIPVLTSVLQIIRTSLPVPFWVSELHVGTTMLALLIGLVGGGVHLRAFVSNRRS